MRVSQGFKHKNKRKTPNRKTKIKMGTTVYESCHTEGRKEEHGKKLKQMGRVGCCVTHIKWKDQETKENIFIDSISFDAKKVISADTP
jgi:hypothetical protein